ncbi:molybdopterin converting factor subunit 1 [Rhodoferax sp. OV413]|uniref:molybdopterin converting factor subunit 1 n=1 Tax=Rhodoferax sp. OV413 TaxID=1855285 RepID=UPI0025DDE10B|nr:molybdopterin converting factor subunit 1 [Rhodoferax sp. OV413]
MKVTVRYFAAMREAMGTQVEVLDTPAATLAELRSALIARGGAGAEALGGNRAVRMALNQVMSAPDAALSEGCEVAFFPPVTGG